jgi:hypothetical protein
MPVHARIDTMADVTRASGVRCTDGHVGDGGGAAHFVRLRQALIAAYGARGADRGLNVSGA